MPAIFGQRMLAAGFSGEVGGSEPVKNYVYRLDGLTQYWQLSETITLPSNKDCSLEVGFSATSENNSWTTILSSSDSTLVGTKSGVIPSVLQLNLAGQIIWGTENWVSNEYRVAEIVRNPDGTGSLRFKDGTTNFSSTDGFDVSRMGAQVPLKDFLPGYIKYIKVVVDGVITNELNLTDKDQGATQLPTVGNVSATIVNYTESGWEEV